MKKRIASLLLCVVMVLSLTPISTYASAGTDGSVSFSAEKTTLKVGETTDLTFKVNATAKNVGAINFNVNLPDGLEYVSHQILVNSSDFSMSSYTSESGYFGCGVTTNGKKGEFDVLKITVRAKDSSLGNNEISVTMGNMYETDGTTEMSFGTCEPVTIETYSEITGNVEVGINPPDKGAVAATSVTGTNYNGGITWDKALTSDKKYKASTVYTASVTLTANTNYRFASTATPSLTGNGTVSDTTISSGGKTMTFKAKFPETAATEDPQCTAPTGLTATYGQKLSEISLSNPAGNTEGKWTWANGDQEVGNVGKNNFEATFTPSNLDYYKTLSNIAVSVTVSAKSLTDVAIANIDDQQYTGNQITPAITVTGDDGKTLVKDSDYTVTYGENKTVASNGGSVTVKAKTDGNYTFSDVTKEFNIVPKAGQISISGKLDKTYDASSVSTDSLTVKKNGSTGAVTYKFYTNEACTEGETAEAPANTGTYWVKATMAADTNFGSATSNALKFTISQRDITNATITLGTAPEYNGSEQSISITSVTIDELTLTPTTDYTVVSGQSATDVGETTLKIKATDNGNYTGEATKTWSLQKKQSALADFTCADSSKSVTYNGKAQGVTPPTTDKKGMGAPTVYYEGASGTTYTKSKDAPTNAGTYTVTFNIAAGDNYTAATDLNYGTLTISQATMDNLTVDVKTPQTAVKRIGNFTEPTFKIGDIPVSGALTYSGNIGGSFSGESYDTVMGKLAVAEKDIDYTLTYSFTPTDKSNFNTASPKKGDITVTVKDIEFKVGEDTATESNAINSLTDDTTYGKTWAQRISLKTIAANVDTVSKEGTYTIVPTTGTLTNRPAVGNQTYKVTFTSEDNTYQNVEVFSGSITVTAKPVTITGISAQNKVYDGNHTATATGIATAKVNGVLDGDTVTITAGTATFADKNVGTAKDVTFTNYSLGGDSAGNYTLTAQPAKVTANIAAKEVTLTGGISATNRAYAVGNRTVGLTKGEATFTGLADGESLDITIPATGTVKDANVGTGKTVTYSGVALADKDGYKASNYTLASTLPDVTVEITKATAPTLATQAKSVKVGVTEQQSVDLSKLMPSDAGTLTYTLGTATDNDSILETGEETRAAVSTDGLYTFTLKSSAAAKQSATVPVTIGSKNYADATATINISVVSKDVPVVTVNDITVTYNGSAVSKASITGTATIGENTTVEGSFDWATGVTAPTNVADSKGYNVTFTPTDTSNYEAVTKAIQVTINQATVSGTPSFNTVSEAGKKLSDVTPTDFTSLTPSEGTFAWNDGENTEVVQGTSYGWTFTPSDANYATLTGNVTPWAKSSYSGGGGGAAIIVQKPVITNGSNGSYTLSTDGTTATFTPNAGYEFDKVTVNGKEVTLKDGKLTGLKTGDKVEVTYKQTTDAADKQISEVKEKVAALSLKARSSKTAKKNVKVVASLSAEAKAAISDIQNPGYTVKYKFYRSTKKASGYKAMLTSTSGKYTNTIGKKGTMYYYKLRVMVYDANGNLVTQSALKQCKYANRLWTK